VEAEVEIRSVEKKQTRSGNTRYAVRDAEGREYSTFRPAIGEEATRCEGRRARITYHESERNGFVNVYLDSVEALDEPPDDAASGDAPAADQVAWSTAVEAAPWLLGTREPNQAVEPEEFFERLEPFKRLVADDIREGPEDPDDDPGEEVR
jgi:hypothetical protein